MSDVEQQKEVYLEADKEIPGQHYVALTFISPEKVIKNKDLYMFSEFLKDYEVQYKIKATESYIMSEMNKLQEHAAALQDAYDNLRTKDSITKGELEDAFKNVKDVRAIITKDIGSSLEKHVKANMTDYKESTIEEAYNAFLFKNKKKLEDDFFAKNSFRTTIRGLKVRGVYDTYNEAMARAKTLQKIDPAFNVYIGQVGFWLPWDPEPTDVGNMEYADDQLNQLMKKYKENENQRDEFFEEMKRKRMTDAKKLDSAPVAGPSADAPSAMFEGEDLAIARKKEAAANANTISHT
jgi:hypothetical protein